MKQPIPRRFVMMLLRRSVPGALLVLALTLGATPAALASNVSPGEGPAFGEHVSDMAPEHPIEHGRKFGECVSGMAIGQCPHHGD
jgi:hypothetical protein